MYLKIKEPNTSLTEIESDSSDLPSDDETRYTTRINNIFIECNKTETKGNRPIFNFKEEIPLIATEYRKNNVIRRVAKRFGLQEVNEDDNWDLQWCDTSLTLAQCKELKRFQKLNHLPGILQLSRKSLLALNLNKMLQIFPDDYNFFPKTWRIPGSFKAALKYSKSNKNKTFIVKPDTGSQGKGIKITKSLDESVAADMYPDEKRICQLYVEKPFLIDGYKFDMRLYALITSCDPLRVYIYREGLIRFASCPYEEPSEENMENVFMHLTNYAVNKLSDNYNVDSESGTKRKLSWFNSYMRGRKYNVESLWYKIDEVTVKTILSVYPALTQKYISNFVNHNVRPACFELLGLDVLIDEQLNPILLEVNCSPSYQTNTKIDLEVKDALFSDLFAMMNLNIDDKKNIIREDGKTNKKRLFNGEKNCKPDNDNKNFEEYFKQEFANRGGFRLIYPSPIEHDYSKFLDQE